MCKVFESLGSNKTKHAGSFVSLYMILIKFSISKWEEIATNGVISNLQDLMDYSN